MKIVRGRSTTGGLVRRLMLGLTLAALLTACGGNDGDEAATDTPDEASNDAPDSDATLTFVSWGGALQEAQMASFAEPFERATGATVTQESPTSYAELRAQVEAGNVSWDVVNVEPHIAVQGCEEGWLEPIDYELAASYGGFEVDDIMSEFMHECGAPDMYYGYTIAFNTDHYGDGNHPKNWEEFFDVETYPGTRAFWRSASSGILEAALVADGVAQEDMYPLDYDRAFAKLDSIKGHLIFYEGGADQIDILATGEAPLIMGWNGRIYDAQQDGLPVAQEWNEHIERYTVLVIPKGVEDVDLAHRFIGHALSEEGQAAFSSYIPYAPVNQTAIDHVDPDMRDELATGPDALGRGVHMDFEYYGANYDEATEKFEEWLLR